MSKNELEQNINFLLSAALNKCGNLEDAQDLTQESLLSALVFLSKGGIIEDTRAWLLVVLNRKYYDLLRKKYKMPTISCDTFFDIADDNDNFVIIEKSEEAESIRREIAYLSKLYREVIIRHYLKSQSVEKIASELDIPIGTVKSRLYGGREQIKKGINTMENYTKQSYEPKELHVSHSGKWGLNGEPYSIVYDDLLAQNILILAYEQPLSEVEISKAIGIPTAYIERTINKLVKNELMIHKGNKFYTDFIIYKPEEQFVHIPAQKQLVSKYFKTFWSPINDSLELLKKTDSYIKQSKHQKSKLEYYFTMSCLDYGFYCAGKKVYGEQIFPQRPNGGSWNAMGYIKTELVENPENRGFSYSGERYYYFESYLNSKSICMHVYNTPLEKKQYQNTINNMKSDDLTQLIYIISENLNPAESGFNMMFLENIPYLCECGIFHTENQKLKVDIPILSMKESTELYTICNKTIQNIVKNTADIMAKYLKNVKIQIPKHLTSVPEQKQYMQAMNCIHMMIVYEAKKQGLIFKDVDYPCPPMIMVIDK